MEIFSIIFIFLLIILIVLTKQWLSLQTWKLKYYLSEALQETILNECLESRSSQKKHLKTIRELISFCDSEAKSLESMGILNGNQDRYYLSKLLNLIDNPKSGLDAVACVTIPKTQEDELADESWSDF